MSPDRGPAPTAGSESPGDAQAAIDWQAWNAAYADPSSPLAQRLVLVQAQVRAALDGAPAGPINVISVCAGQGHDLIGALDGHPRREDVRGRLVELDTESVRLASVALGAAGLSERIEAVAGDASLTDAYLGAVPADLILLCGVLGNISEQDVDVTIDHLPELCAARATVIWTRHRNPPDLVPHIVERLERAGFGPISFSEAPHFGVGVSRLLEAPRPLLRGVRLFHFIGHEALWPHLDAPLRSALGALFRPGFTLVELVEAVRMLPPGGGPEQTPQGMLRQARGTSAPKHLFLAQVLAQSFPSTDPQIVHRVHRLLPERAAELYGAQVAAALPPEGIVDVHRYLLVDLGAGHVALDATTAGDPWDARSPLPPVCGPGTDVIATDDPERERGELEAEHCDAQARAPFLAVVRECGL
jgi:hypothetical protein